MKNADQPAMPTDSVEDTGAPYFRQIKSNGLTKREIFAMAAMQGMLANAVLGGDFVKYNHEGMMVLAVQKADKLLAELDKG